MNRSIILTLFAACVASTLLNSCDPLEPDTYDMEFYRLATVEAKDGKANLLLDYTDEEYLFKNFSTEEDATRFGVADGDRVIAKMTINMISGITASKLNLNEILWKSRPVGIAQSKPVDSLNYQYTFSYLYMGDMRYPYIWNQGHLLNLAPIFYTKADQDVREFYLYPEEVYKDTLRMRLYSYIPNHFMSSTSDAQQDILCYDMSTLRDSVPVPEEHKHRRQIMNYLDSIHPENIFVQVFSPDTVRGVVTFGDTPRKYSTLPDILWVGTSMPFDF